MALSSNQRLSESVGCELVGSWAGECLGARTGLLCAESIRHVASRSLAPPIADCGTMVDCWAVAGLTRRDETKQASTQWIDNARSTRRQRSACWTSIRRPKCSHTKLFSRHRGNESDSERIKYRLWLSSVTPDGPSIASSPRTAASSVNRFKSPRSSSPASSTDCPSTDSSEKFHEPWSMENDVAVHTSKYAGAWDRLGASFTGRIRWEGREAIHRGTCAVRADQESEKVHRIKNLFGKLYPVARA